jgi:hypothetical protein
MECLGLHNKPKAEVHLEHKLTGQEEVEVEAELHSFLTSALNGG